MPIRSRINQYLGVNAHLHSHLQHERGGWEVFHSAHVIHLAEAIDAVLPSGYLLDPEKSFQIREVNPDTGEKTASKPWKRPDITIYDTTPKFERTSRSELVIPTLTLPAVESFDIEDDLYLSAIGIHEINEDDTLGKLVTWIELLSPTNKPPGVGYRQYHEKRNAALQNSIVLVEIDYLHETRSPIRRLANYRELEPSASPYAVVVTDPRPTLQDGQMDIYNFVVDEPIPMIKIPLARNDTITLSLQTVYDYTYHRFGSYSYRVDYEQLPAQFDTYREDDQARIQARMRAVVQAQARGLDLETGPFPLDIETL